jgi:hypothetical protein
VWLSVAARSVEGKAVAIAFPISAFVALGFEHCIANFYLLPMGMLSGANVTLADVVANIVPVTIGNTVGGVVVAIAYYLIYLRNGQAKPAAAAETEVPAKKVVRVKATSAPSATATTEVVAVEVISPAIKIPAVPPAPRVIAPAVTVVEKARSPVITKPLIGYRH